MRQVDTCDFCGDAPEGVFEVVPAAVPDGPVRLALCGDCQRTLETVVDPLLDADADEAGRGGDGRRDDAGAAGESGAGTTATAREASDERPATTAAGTDASDSTGGPRSSGDADEGSDGTGAVGDETGAGSEDDEDEDEDEDGITIEEPSGGTPAERPDGYAQVLRLLENRDDGMPRSDLRSLATNAYDLTDASFEAAVEAAIENGDVEDTTGGLRRT